MKVDRRTRRQRRPVRPTGSREQATAFRPRTAHADTVRPDRLGPAARLPRQGAAAVPARGFGRPGDRRHPGPGHEALRNRELRSDPRGSPGRPGRPDRRAHVPLPLQGARPCCAARNIAKPCKGLRSEWEGSCSWQGSQRIAVYEVALRIAASCEEKRWWARQDSNLRPMDYESTALTN